MTIAEIKSRLTIMEVLSSYNLVPSKNNMLNCPFHGDKQPSMKVFQSTNTVYCYAGTCEVQSLDVIDFMMKKDKSSKRAAILKAKKMIDPTMKNSNDKSVKSKSVKEEKSKAMRENKSSDYKIYRGSIKKNKGAQEYCVARCLDYELLEIGYKSRKTKTRWGRGCIIFPLRNALDEIVSFYGRSIFSQSHFYESGRSGLYPAYPKVDTKTLVLTECVIDAASLQGLNLPLENYSLLALYGVQNFTKEHDEAITKLEDLEEVVFCLDGDEAGEKATKDYAKLLHEKYPGLQLTKLVLPQGEDINSLAIGHENYQALFTELFHQRKSLTQNIVLKMTTKNDPTSKLDTNQTTNLKYKTSVANYYIKGGVRYSEKDLDSLRITLVVENNVGKQSRNKLDLYEDKQIEKVCSIVSSRLDLRSDLLELDIHLLCNELEAYREELCKNNKGEGEQSLRVPDRVVAAVDQRECLSFWRSKNLIKKLQQLLGQSGIVGEEKNRLLGFCIASTYNMGETLHGIIEGESGSGKTHLLHVISDLIPMERHMAVTRMTDRGFYHYRKEDLKGTFMSIEDRDAFNEEVNLAFRELQTNNKLILWMTQAQDDGKYQTVKHEVEGPVASLCCTTNGELYLDDMNRCFLMTIDLSEAQDQRIKQYHQGVSAGLIDRSAEQKTKLFLQNCLRLLKPYEVLNSYAPYIDIPVYVKDKRRLRILFQKLMRHLTRLHQYQRKIDKKGRLLSELSDVENAVAIMFDAIVLKADDLNPVQRVFFESVKNYVRKEGGTNYKNFVFKQRPLRQWLLKSRVTVKRYVRSLVAMEYLKVVGGNDHQGWQYKISYWDDLEGLRTRVKEDMYKQLSQLSQLNALDQTVGHGGSK